MLACLGDGYPLNIPEKALANVSILLGISVEKKDKNGATWIGRGIFLRLSGISSGYPSLRQASTVLLLFFPRIFLGIS